MTSSSAPHACTLTLVDGELRVRERVAERERENHIRVGEEVGMSAPDDVATRLGVTGALAAGIAHELRNLLGVAQTSVFLAKRAPHDAEVLTRHLDKIERSVRTAQDVLTNLLSLARGGAIEGEPAAIREVVDDALATIRVPQDVTVAVDIVPEDLDGRCDPVLFARALANLVGNAIEGSMVAGERARARHVRIEARRSEQGLVLSVEDDGPGIEVATLWSGRTTKPEGTGLGMLVVRAVVEAHGGRVDATSSASGTRFVLTLPRG